MLAFYIRSSAIGTYKLCQQQFFIRYVLGHKDLSNKRADIGSAVHKVLEGIALVNKARVAGESSINDPECFGEIPLTQCTLNNFVDKAFTHFKEKSPHLKWYPKDKQDIYSGASKVLTEWDGNYHPIKRDIHSTEYHFDIELQQDWAKYEYEIKGQKYEGRLRIKGTVDLIAKVNVAGKPTLEIIDWKGLPLDTLLPTPLGWTTMGEVKVGDYVYDMYGARQKVLAKSSVKNKHCYNITFDDLTSVVCDDEHLWRLDDGRVIPVTKLQKGDKIPVAADLMEDDTEWPDDLKQAGRDVEVWPALLRMGIASKLSYLEGVLDKHGKRIGSFLSISIEDKAKKEFVLSLLLSMGQKVHERKYSIEFAPTNLSGLSGWIPGDIVEAESVRVVKSVTPLAGTRETQCISVSGETQTYLCTAYYIPTHNTGQCKDWGTGKAKTLEDFYNDHQLRFYFYALSQEFPDQDFFFTIVYINNEGPFTLAYDRSELPAIEQDIKKFFEEVKALENPTLKNDSFCGTICHFGKNNYPGADKTICKFYHDELVQLGAKATVDKHIKLNEIVSYSGGGKTLDTDGNRVEKM